MIGTSNEYGRRAYGKSYGEFKGMYGGPGSC